MMPQQSGRIKIVVMVKMLLQLESVDKDRKNDTVSTHTYNADGMQISKTANGEETQYIWDGEGRATAYFRGNGLVMQMSEDEALYYTMNDHGGVIFYRNL